MVLFQPFSTHRVDRGGSPRSSLPLINTSSILKVKKKAIKGFLPIYSLFQVTDCEPKLLLYAGV